MTPILHNYSAVAGETMLWDTSDSEKLFHDNLQHPDRRAVLEKNGFLNRPVTYQYNSHGFRNREFDTQIDVVCFGCSFTMGTGVHLEHTWPWQLQQLTGLNVANLGHAGSSNDTAFRFAKYYLPLLKPRWAIWVQTDQHRLELIDNAMPMVQNILATDTTNPCSQDYFIKTWFACQENQELNLEKNTRAFRHLCMELEIISHVLPRSSVQSDRQARDLSHPGPRVYEKLAKQVHNLLGRPESVSVES